MFLQLNPDWSFRIRDFSGLFFRTSKILIQEMEFHEDLFVIQCFPVLKSWRKEDAASRPRLHDSLAQVSCQAKSAPTISKNEVPVTAFPPTPPCSQKSGKTPYLLIFKASLLVRSRGRGRDEFKAYRRSRPIPLTRLAPADETAGCDPPSPPRGRGNRVKLISLCSLRQFATEFQAKSKTRVRQSRFCALHFSDGVLDCVTGRLKMLSGAGLSIQT